MKIDVILIDDHAMILEGLSGFLSSDSSICIKEKLSTESEINKFIESSILKSKNSITLPLLKI